MSRPAPLRIWAVSDGRTGIEAQALGLAEAVARLTPAEIVLKHIAWPAWMRRLPTRLMPATPAWLANGRDGLKPPWPDLWIANGRASVPLSIGVRRWSGGRTFTVQLQDPLRTPGRFDLVAPPNHDGRAGENVFGITGTPHRVTPERLATALDAFPHLADLPHPHVVALIGGRSKAFGLSPARAATLAADIRAAVEAKGGSLLLTFSRRTPADAEAQMREALQGLPGTIWDGTGPNPYFAFLASADHILVTEDSANMPAEAGATGKPVHLLRMDGGQARKRRFHAELAQRGVARPFDRRLESWTYPPLRETERVAEEVLRRMAARGGSAPRVQRQARRATALGVHLLELLAFLAVGALSLQRQALFLQLGGADRLLRRSAFDLLALSLLGAGGAHGLQLLLAARLAVDDLAGDDGGLGLEPGEHRLLRFRRGAQPIVEAGVSQLLLHI